MKKNGNINTIENKPEKPKFFILALATAMILSLSFAIPAQVVVRGTEGKPLHEDRPAPRPLREAGIPLVYGHPSPSLIKPELLGPVQLLQTARIDLEAGTATLPLYKGKVKGSNENVWYIITDTNDIGKSELLGVAYSPKLIYADIARAARSGMIEKDGTITFDQGKVDFRPERSLTPGDAPAYFPPKKSQPGAIGDRDYSPVVKTTNGAGIVYNAPVVSFGTSAEQLERFAGGNPDYRLVHDKVVRISPKEGTVTLKLTIGYTFAKPLLYLSTDASDPVAATLEEATLAPGLKDVATSLEDAAIGSGSERLVSIVNGPMGKDNPHRQGLNSAIADGQSPLNILGGIPTITLDYSPLWDFMPAVWTKEAIDKGYRTRMIDLFQLYGLAEKGYLTNPDGGKVGSSGIVINCPVVMRMN